MKGSTTFAMGRSPFKFLGAASKSSPLCGEPRWANPVVYHHFSHELIICTPITMAKCHCYYRANARPIPPKVGSVALPGPISITWCEGIFVYGPRALFYGVGYNYLTVIMWKTQQCTGPLNNNWPLCPKHLNMTTDIGVTNDITIINRLMVDIFA